MEPDVMPLHPFTHPPLDDDDDDDDDDDGGLGSEEDEFGDFTVGVSCSSPGFADDAEPPSFFRQPSTTVKPATHQPNSCFNQPVEQSQHISTVKLESGRASIHLEGKNCSGKTLLHLTNGYAQGDHKCGTHVAPVVGACSPEEETGFADFSVFREQAAHPWCCGLTEQWDGNVGGTNHIRGEQISHSGRGVIMESEPVSQHLLKAKEDLCITVEHFEKRDAAFVQPPQDHHQPQEAAAGLEMASVEEKWGMSVETRGEEKWSCNSLETSEVLTITESMYESASDNLTSMCNDLSFESASADLEPNVSYVASQDDQTDWDGTDDEDEELRYYQHADSCSSVANPSLTELEKDYDGNHCVIQETSPTSSQSRAGTNTKDKRPDFTDGCLEHHRDQEPVQTADAGVQSPGNLPPSDSFADFCSAPTQEDCEGLWADFEDRSTPVEGKTWTRFREPVSSLQIDGDKEEQERMTTHGAMRWNSCQLLLESSFPVVEVPAEEDEEELLNLSALLQLQPCKSEEEIPDVICAQRTQQVMVWLHQDIHSSLGLQFRWAGSHSNRNLLRCLGVDTGNIVCLATKKQPVTVSTYASSLTVPAACSPGRMVITAPSGPLDKLDLPTPNKMQELPSSQLDWTSRGLSSSQDSMSPRRTPHFWGWK